MDTQNKQDLSKFLPFISIKILNCLRKKDLEAVTL